MDKSFSMPNDGRLVERYSHKNYWFNKSSDLHAAARAIWMAMYPTTNVDPGLGRGFSMGVACTPVFYMLCGLSIETMLKALLTQAKQWGPNDRSHGLQSLAKRLDGQVSVELGAKLDFYADFVLWAGRYPLPPNPDDDKLRDFWSRTNDVLSSEVELGTERKLKFRQDNGAADWEPYHALWGAYSTRFDHRS